MNHRVQPTPRRSVTMLAGTQRALPQSLVQTAGSRVRCLACMRRCALPDGGIGYCTAVVRRGSALYNTTFGVVAEAAVTPIESKPIFHYRPGARVLSLGSLGCNLRCTFCQNWEVAYRDAHHSGGLHAPNLPPERAIDLALAQQCEGVAWTYNEPSIAPTYVLETARLARQAGLFTVYVTNGLLTHEALDVLGPWLDVYRVDVKSLEPAFYRRIGAFDRIHEILPVAQRARRDFRIHVEAVTNVMPGYNDSADQLARLADRLAADLGDDVPWHLTTYVPYAQATDVAPTPPESMERARTAGLRAGLRHVYVDHLSRPHGLNTYCPDCRALLVERTKSRVTVVGLTRENTCSRCHTPIGIVFQRPSPVASVEDNEQVQSRSLAR